MKPSKEHKAYEGIAFEEGLAARDKNLDISYSIYSLHLSVSTT
jgi:hypothetical protein